MRLKVVLLLAATALWLPTLHLWFRPASPRALAPELARRQRALALAPNAETTRLRRVNPEWDRMARTFAVLSFANLALAEPGERAEDLAAIDAILARTLQDERTSSDRFLLPYVHRAEFRDPVGRSLFVDGELALMLAARQLVEPKPSLALVLRQRVDLLVGSLARAPVLAAESYPDEGWTFCNTIALAAIRASDVLDGRDHSALLRRWVASAKEHLVEPRTGLLVSSFTWDGRTLDGPEGSTLWLAAHMLQVVDADFARDQYLRARRELVGERFGFAWAAEWPAGARRREDVDSGPTVPLVDANAGSSGLALLGASAFGSEELLTELVTSLSFAAFPMRDEAGLRFAAGNQLADAVLLYSLVQGPLWQRIDQQGLARADVASASGGPG